jgi:hypothetical protein
VFAVLVLKPFNIENVDVSLKYMNFNSDLELNVLVVLALNKDLRRLVLVCGPIIYAEEEWILEIVFKSRVFTV